MALVGLDNHSYPLTKYHAPNTPRSQMLPSLALPKDGFVWGGWENVWEANHLQPRLGQKAIQKREQTMTTGRGNQKEADKWRFDHV